MPAERTTTRQVREVLRLKFVGGFPIRETVLSAVGACPPHDGVKPSSPSETVSARPRSPSRASSRLFCTACGSRRNGVQLVDEEGCRLARIRRSQGSRDTAGKVVPAGTVAVVRSSDFLRASKGTTALATLVRQRRSTPATTCRKPGRSLPRGRRAGRVATSSGRFSINSAARRQC
jgi:hypothetical protein